MQFLNRHQHDQPLKFGNEANDPSGPHVGPMNFAIWVLLKTYVNRVILFYNTMSPAICIFNGYDIEYVIGQNFISHDDRALKFGMKLLIHS